MQPHQLSDDEFIHEISLRDDPVSKRMVELLDKAQDKVAELLDGIEEADRILTLGEELEDWLNRLPEGAMGYLERVVEDYEAARIWVCEDCLMAIANDDYTGFANDAQVEATKRGLEQLDHPTPGELIREFSSYPCGCCGTPLSGSRHEVFEVGKIR